MRHIFIIINIFFFCSITFSQSLFVKKFPYTPSSTIADNKSNTSILITKSNKLVLGAIKAYIDNAFSLYTYSTFFKTDDNGNLIFSKTFRNPDDIQPADIIESKDGSYYLTGHSHQMDTISNVFNFILKTDSLGNVLWSKSSIDSIGTYGLKMVELNDSIIFGTSSYNGIYYYAINKNGNVKFEKLLKGIGSDNGRSLLVNKGSVYLLSNTINTFDTLGEFLINKIGPNGNLLWSKRYHFTNANLNLNGLFISKCGDNLLGVAGNIYNSSNSTQDFFACTFDTNGVAINSKVYDIFNEDDLTSFSPNNTNGFLMNCLANPPGGPGKFVTISFDINLNVTDAKHVLNTAYGFGTQGPTILRKNNRMFLGGIQYNNNPVSAMPFIIKLDTNFNTACINPSVPINTSFAAIVSNTCSFNEEIIELLKPKSVYSQNILFTDSIYCASFTALNENFVNEKSEIYPNPFDVKLKIISINEIQTVSIYDVTGKLIYLEEVHNIEATIDTKNIPKGFYLIKITSENHSEVRKLVKE